MSIFDQSWEVTYPAGLLKYINFFRLKNFNYEGFNDVFCDYIDQYRTSEEQRICSLGSGTGTREFELASRGYYVLGLDRHDESLDFSQKITATDGENVEFLDCDFLNFDEVDKKLEGYAPFDVISVMLIPISIKDHARVAKHFAKYLVQGGIFITGLWGWSEEIDTQQGLDVSSIEVATDPNDNQDYAVRLNYYSYIGNLIKWDAIYLYPDENNVVCMGRDHDELEMSPEEEGVDPLGLPSNIFEVLPSHKITNCPKLTPPHVYEYLIGWIKK